LGVKMIVSSGAQLAPRLMLTGQRVSGAPPEKETFFSSLLVTNPTHFPSGEKKGW
jgi:hypothetical protein